MKQFLATDSRLSQQFTLSSESGWWQWARFLAHAGDGPYVFSGLGCIYLLGWLWQDDALRQANSLIALIVFLAIVAVTIIKFTIRRQRPHPPGEFVKLQYDLYSFPSGHAARMAALAVSTIFFYPVAGWALIIVTVGVAVARILVGVHYLSDVIGGLCTGALVAWLSILLLISIM